VGGLGVALFIRSTAASTSGLPDISKLGPLDPEIQDIVRQARESVAQDPRDALRWGRFGMVCEANGLSGAARDAYAQAAKLQDGQAKWWFHLASVETRLGQADQAVRDMRRAAELQPTFAPAYWHLGLLLLDQNDVIGAEHAFDRATEIDGKDRAGWIGLARVYLQRNENERVVGLLEHLADAGSIDRYALQLLGTAYRRLGRNEDAEPALSIGAAGQPEWSDPWTDEMLAFRRGYAALLKDATALIVAGRIGPAISILENLRQTRPDDVVLMAHLGQVYVAAGRDAEAIPLLQQVIAREPERFEPYVDLATGYMHQNDLVQARAAVERALSLNASYAPAHETHALILWRGGSERAAVAEFEEAARLDPRNARALVWLGMLETNLGKSNEAIVAFQRAVKVDMTGVDAWIGLANAEMSQHDLEAAKVAVARALRLQPDRPAVKETAERLKSLSGGGK
jgi:tetratricopeptide (TPR) repeat protein